MTASSAASSAPFPPLRHARAGSVFAIAHTVDVGDEMQGAHASAAAAAAVEHAASHSASSSSSSLPSISEDAEAAGASTTAASANSSIPPPPTVAEVRYAKLNAKFRFLRDEFRKLQMQNSELLANASANASLW